MCLYVKRGVMRQTASKDITVYKLLVSQVRQTLFLVSPYYRACLWEPGCTRNSKLNGPYKGRINEGLHAYLNEYEAVRAARMRVDGQVIEMIIPKGAEYYADKYGHEIATTRLHWPNGSNRP